MASLKASLNPRLASRNQGASGFVLLTILFL
jgi:hypothetical protein